MTVEVIETYVACDGKSFEDKVECQMYEDHLILNYNRLKKAVNQIITICDNFCHECKRCPFYENDECYFPSEEAPANWGKIKI